MSVDRTAQFNAALSGDTMTVAKFQTKACVVCRRLDPGLQATAERLAGQVRIVDVDADEQDVLAARYNVRSVPTLILFKDGVEIDRCNGFQSTGMLRDWIAPHLDL